MPNKKSRISKALTQLEGLGLEPELVQKIRTVLEGDFKAKLQSRVVQAVGQGDVNEIVVQAIDTALNKEANLREALARQAKGLEHRQLVQDCVSLAEKCDQLSPKTSRPKKKRVRPRLKKARNVISNDSSWLSDKVQEIRQEISELRQGLQKSAPGAFEKAKSSLPGLEARLEELATRKGEFELLARIREELKSSNLSDSDYPAMVEELRNRLKQGPAEGVSDLVGRVRAAISA